MPDREKTIKGLEEIKEYIREKVNDLGSRKCRMLDKVDYAVALLKEQPEIVRCRDCKRAKLIMWGDQENYECYPPETDDVPEAYLEPECTPWHEGDFYCAYGERKED